MTEIIDPHPDVLAEVTSPLPAAKVEPVGQLEVERAAQAADGKLAVDVAVNLTKIGLALTGWAQVALDRAMTGLDLFRQGWEAKAKVWLKPADGKFGPGFMRINLRVTGGKIPVDFTGTAHVPDAPMVEEHHSVMDFNGLPTDAAMVAGLMQAALSELVDIVGPPLRRRLRAAGVIELPELPCAGAMCVGCGGMMCPRTVERRG